jgi:phage/plasmid-associated DNA primase
MWYSNLNKLCFKNGYYDFKSKSFKKYDNETYSPIYINYDYVKADPEKKKEVYDLILDPIIPNKEQQEYMLNWLARGLAGCYTDKTWAVGLGLRNSGKGVLTEAILKTVECYAGTFRADEMMNSDTGSGDIAKKYAWLMDFEYRRLNFSNELKEMDSKKRATILDGNVIKSISSGGDNQEARKNFKNQVTFKIQGRMMLNLNNLVTCSPADCNETLQIFTFKNEFKKESDFTERDRKINERGDRKILIANNNIKNLFLEESYKLALLEILIENYTDIQKEAPEITKNNKEDVIDKDDDITNRLENYIELTDNQKDKILISECNSILKKYFKLSQIKTGMMKLGVTESKSNGERYYRFIKMREEIKE